MNRKTYRICLVMLIMAAVVSGILYYRFAFKKGAPPNEGTFVWNKIAEGECV